MNKVLFFAQIRELIGVSELMIESKDYTISQLLEQLAQKGDKWSLALTEKNVLCAVNQSFVDKHYLVQENDEIAFFPPVTGG